jgi:hypothetical protein
MEQHPILQTQQQQQQQQLSCRNFLANALLVVASGLHNPPTSHRLIVSVGMSERQSVPQ